MLKKVVLAVGLIAIPSVAPAQQQPEQQQPQQQQSEPQQPQQQLCQLECTYEKSERVTRNCHALNAGDCANLGRAETGVGRTCRGFFLSPRPAFALFLADGGSTRNERQGNCAPQIPGCNYALNWGSALPRVALFPTPAPTGFFSEMPTRRNSGPLLR
jgi:hypothetical protein